MSSQTNNNAFSQLVSDCIAHLDAEAALLQETDKVVDGFRDSLMSGGPPPTDQWIQQMAVFGRQINQLQVRRETLRKRLSAGLGVGPEAATVGRLANVSDPKSRLELNTLRQRLREQGDAINGRIAAFANLVVQMMELTENVFRALAGKSAGSTIYERTGRKSLPVNIQR